MFRKLLLPVLFIVFFASCKPSVDTTTIRLLVPAVKQDMTWADLRWFITKENKINADADVFPDGYYTVVDEEFFKNVVLNQFKSFLELNNMQIANEEKNNCNKFARAFTLFSRIQSNKIKDLKYSMAVADYYYTVFLVKGHAVNIAVVFDNKTNLKKVIYIEPQTQTIIDVKTSPDFTNDFFISKFVGF